MIEVSNVININFNKKVCINTVFKITIALNREYF